MIARVGKSGFIVYAGSALSAIELFAAAGGKARMQASYLAV
jgi:hypothetical protein